MHFLLMSKFGFLEVLMVAEVPMVAKATTQPLHSRILLAPCPTALHTETATKSHLPDILR